MKNIKYDKGIFIDVVNGIKGTEVPVGMAHCPVNNLNDALEIAKKYNIPLKGILI